MFMVFTIIKLLAPIYDDLLCKLLRPVCLVDDAAGNPACLVTEPFALGDIPFRIQHPGALIRLRFADAFTDDVALLVFQKVADVLIRTEPAVGNQDISRDIQPGEAFL